MTMLSGEQETSTEVSVFLVLNKIRDPSFKIINSLSSAKFSQIRSPVELRVEPQMVF